MTRTVLTFATLSTGLVAGLFAAFAYAVSPGLRRVDDDAFVQTMRAVNAAILNPVFGLLFAGGLVAVVAAGVLTWSSEARPWVVAGAVLYAATVLVTLAANVPLNDALAVGDGSPAHLRSAFEDAWTRWNLVRTATGTAAFGCLVVAGVHL
ncbi:MAG: DUF1772 domain-containing protein [Propionibacteriales bacterium]|nr:DUF1772 domain-containing protein [Propionibacteriales bacterium]